MAAPNPFTKPTHAARRVKALFWGGPGSGKTYAGLSFPGPIAVLDAEAGTIHYAGREGLSEFHHMLTRSYADAREAIDWLRNNPGHYKTVMVDPITLIYNVLQESAQEKAARRYNDVDADIDIAGRGRVARNYQALSAELINLPMNVVVVARESTLYDNTGSSLKAIGEKADAHKSAEYDFDTVLHFRKLKDGSREFEVVKDRLDILTEGKRYALPNVTAGIFASIFPDLGGAEEGEDVSRPNPEAAVQHDAVATWGADDVAGPELASQVIMALKAIGQDPAEVIKRYKGMDDWARVPLQSAQGILERAQTAAAKPAQEAEPEATAPAQDVPAPTGEVLAGTDPSWVAPPEDATPPDATQAKPEMTSTSASAEPAPSTADAEAVPTDSGPANPSTGELVESTNDEQANDSEPATPSGK